MDFAARIDGLLTRFSEAHGRLVARLQTTTEVEASAVSQPGRWTPAQIGAHVAGFNDLLARLISGDLPHAGPAPDGFVERPWPEIQASLLDPVEAPRTLQPEADVSRDASLTALSASATLVSDALRALTPERGLLTVTHPRVGTIRLIQAGDWIVAHTIRHNAQLKRALGR